jgi:hypothetical protein
LAPSLKNIIIILNYLFGLGLYKDSLEPFKNKKFCSTYFSKMCEKLGWCFDGNSSNLDDAYYKWDGTKLKIRLKDWPKNYFWDIFISSTHADIQNCEMPLVQECPEKLKELFSISLIENQSSVELFDLFFTCAYTESMSCLTRDDIMNLVFNLSISTKLKRLKDLLLGLKNKLYLLKSKLEFLSDVI